VFDVYTTTTTPNHERVVHEVFGRLRRNGFVEEALQESAFCLAEGRSLPDRYVEGECPHCGEHQARGDQCDACGHTLDPSDLVRPRCLRCGGDATLRPLRQLVFRLDRAQPDVEGFLEASEGWRTFVRQEAFGWVRTGLRPRAITRDLAWGVRVPLDGWDDRRFYVWFEDVIGYLSATIEAAGESWRDWWTGEDVRHLYFIGKDNIPFHAVWWPALLAATGCGLHLPDEVVANHHLTFGARKASASRGVGVTLDEALDRLGTDPLRHALVALNPETQDVEFTWALAGDLRRTGLLGAISNPAHRVATLLWKRFGGRVDAEAWEAGRAEASALLAPVGKAYRERRLRRALRSVWDIGASVNRALAASEPWRKPDAEALPELSRLLALIEAVSVGAWPVVPGVAGNIRATLGRRRTPEEWAVERQVPVLVAEPVRPL
jgi:methionyl-tRNA synthetase